MASLIFLGGMFGFQEPMDELNYRYVIERPFGDVDKQVAIAKGNIIEGIQAME